MADRHAVAQMTGRYRVEVVADEHLDSTNGPEEALGASDRLEEAQEIASTVGGGYPYGAAIVDTQTGLVDYGAGFGRPYCLACDLGECDEHRTRA